MSKPFAYCLLALSAMGGPGIAFIFVESPGIAQDLKDLSKPAINCFKPAEESPVVRAVNCASARPLSTAGAFLPLERAAKPADGVKFLSDSQSRRPIHISLPLCSHGWKPQIKPEAVHAIGEPALEISKIVLRERKISPDLIVPLAVLVTVAAMIEESGHGSLCKGASNRPQPRELVARSSPFDVVAPSQAWPASEDSMPSSTPRIASARSYLRSKSGSKIRPVSAGQVSQPLARISLSSCPEAQPA
jgi:hypothetical protein